jgi:DNA-directed RNA polymerase I subunit RPA2
VLHFVTTGTAKFMLSFGRELFFVPVVMLLKCLSGRSDAAIYEQLVAGTEEDDHYYRNAIHQCLRIILNSDS